MRLRQKAWSILLNRQLVDMAFGQGLYRQACGTRSLKCLGWNGSAASDTLTEKSLTLLANPFANFGDCL